MYIEFGVKTLLCTEILKAHSYNSTQGLKLASIESQVRWNFIKVLLFTWYPLSEHFFKINIFCFDVVAHRGGEQFIFLAAILFFRQIHFVKEINLL